MGCCESKAPKSVDQYHVGLLPEAVEQIPDESVKAAFCKFQEDNWKGVETIQNDDDDIMTFLLKSEHDGQTHCCFHCCCCCGIFSKAVKVKHDGHEKSYGQTGCCACLVPETCNCCSGLSYLAILRGHQDPRELSHRRFWSIDYTTAKGQVKDCCGISCPTCFGFCPIVGMTTGFCWSPCHAKKMRMIALGFSEEEIQCAGWFCCSSTDWNPSRTKGKYMCFQEYEDRTFIKPALWCKGFTDMCPEAMLNVEVCTYPGLSMSSSQLYFLDTRDLKPDPQYAQEHRLVHHIDQLESLLGHVASTTSDPHTHTAKRCLHAYTSCLKKAQSPVLIYQMKTHAQHFKGEFWPMMQGRHKENNVFKMAHRVVERKSYIIKVTKKFFEGGKGMRDKQLVVDYKLPTQLIMGDIVNKKDDAYRGVNKKAGNKKDDTDYKLPRQLVMGEIVNQKDDADRRVSQKAAIKKDDADRGVSKKAVNKGDDEDRRVTKKGGNKDDEDRGVSKKAVKKKDDEDRGVNKKAVRKDDADRGVTRKAVRKDDADRGVSKKGGNKKDDADREVSKKGGNKKDDADRGVNQKAVKKKDDADRGVNQKSVKKKDDADSEVNKKAVNKSGVNKGGVNQNGVNKSGVNLSGVIQSGVNKSGVNLSGVNQSGVNKKGVNKKGVNKKDKTDSEESEDDDDDFEESEDDDDDFEESRDDDDDPDEEKDDDADSDEEKDDDADSDEEKDDDADSDEEKDDDEDSGKEDDDDEGEEKDGDADSDEEKENHSGPGES